MKLKRILSLLLAAVLLCSVGAAFAGCSSSDAGSGDDTNASDSANSNSDLAYIQDKGTLVVAVTKFEPMNYQNEDGTWTGFDTEFAQAVAEKLGVKAEFVVIDWDNNLSELQSKSVDCLWNGMTITDRIKKGADVTNAYVKNAQVVVMNNDVVNNYNSLDEMSDLSFAAEAGSAGAGVLDDAGIAYTALAAQSDCLMEVQSGASDACVIDLTMANNMTGEGTSYADLGYKVELNEEEYGIAFRKGSDMVEKVNEIMAEMMQDGTLDDLAEKYSLTLIKDAA
ncbi:MAG: transporter substrate-binding domain-containing protein [Clostridiales bacterium]|nr:transporter substrate-binding domain-containing protein [Clostridiales bacterium]